MIVIEEQNDLLKATVYAELSLADFREFETAVQRELKQAPGLVVAEDEGVVAARRLRRREAPLSAPETAGERGQRHRSHLPEQLEVVEVRAPRDVLHGEAEAAAPRAPRPDEDSASA